MLYLQFHSSTCSGGEKIEVAKLKKTNGQLNVRGGVSTADLTAGVEYEVVFVVKLKKGGCGWEHPVIVILSVPGEQRDMRRRRRQVDLCGQQREDGINSCCPQRSTCRRRRRMSRCSPGTDRITMTGCSHPHPPFFSFTTNTTSYSTPAVRSAVLTPPLTFSCPLVFVSFATSIFSPPLHVEE